MGSRVRIRLFHILHFVRDLLFPLFKNSKPGVDDRGHRLRITHTPRRSELKKLERLEFLEKRLKEMENTEARLIQENQQLRVEKEKEQKSRKSESISRSYTNSTNNIKPKNKSNTGHSPPINKVEKVKQ